MRIRSLLSTVALAAILPLAPAPAQADQPYGGCDEAWQAPQSAGADHCRDHGYTVHRQFVLNPRSVAVTLRAQPCRTSTANVCFRAFDTTGVVVNRATGRHWSFSFTD